MLRHFRKATDTLRELVAYYIILIGLSAAVFSFVEDVSFTTSVYWAGITATTTGYGDISPHTAIGRALSVIVANLAVFGLAPLIIARILQWFIQDHDKFTHDEQEEMKARLLRIEAKLDSLIKDLSHVTPD